MIQRMEIYQHQQKRDTHLTEIVSLLSMYQTLSIFQLKKLYPELTKAKLMSFIRRLEKGGRLIYVPETDIVKYSKDWKELLFT